MLDAKVMLEHILRLINPASVFHTNMPLQTECCVVSHRLWRNIDLHLDVVLSFVDHDSHFGCLGHRQSRVFSWVGTGKYRRAEGVQGDDDTVLLAVAISKTDVLGKSWRSRAGAARTAAPVLVVACFCA